MQSNFQDLRAYQTRIAASRPDRALTNTSTGAEDHVPLQQQLVQQPFEQQMGGLREPRKPKPPAEAQDNALPFICQSYDDVEELNVERI